MLAGPEGQEHEAYWLSKLAGVLTPLSMPTDRPRPVSFSDRGASLPIDLGSELSDAVRELAAREGATPVCRVAHGLPNSFAPLHRPE